MPSEFKIPITARKTSTKFALFSLGFRPFFLLASIVAVISLPHWMLGYRGFTGIPDQYPAVGWHAHEMLFGYAAAVIAGFLLTSVRIWTAEDTITGKPLMVLTLIWLLARILPLIPSINPAVIGLIDLLFLPLLALAISLPIIKVKQWRNGIFPLLLLAMTAGNLMIFLQAYYPDKQLAATGLQVGLWSILLLIVIMAGRVVPWFISRGAADSRPRSLSVVEFLSNWSVAALGLVIVLDLGSHVITPVAGITALVHALRLVFWVSKPVWRVPLLWILIVAYAWTVLGFALVCLSHMGFNIPHLAMHAFTTGSIGVMTLGLMARVSLGHSGRTMELHRLTVHAFYLVNIAALLRVFVPLIFPQNYVLVMAMATACWVLAFVFFLIVYTPILVKPRLTPIDLALRKSEKSFSSSNPS